MRIPLDADFSTLPAPQKAAVLAWANSHTWSDTKPFWEGDKLVVHFSEERVGEGWRDVRYEFSTLRALRDEAGY